MLQGEVTMASGLPSLELSNNTLCPICLERFKDPVVVACGHNFCKACLTRYWGESNTEAVCPQCSGAVRQSSFKPNWPLANVNIVKLEEGEKPEGIIVCKEEEIPIALGYDRLTELQNHGEIPMDETSQELKMIENGGMETNNSRRGRGISWRYKETLDLLDIWGQQKIQDELRSSHRNLDFFEYIAKEMYARGHPRTAVECRSKTKVMRLEYKRVIDHNSRPGNNKVTCPFYKQLHRILRGDASVAPKRISRRLKQAPQLGTLPDTSILEDHFLREDLNIINIGDYFKDESTDSTVDGILSGHGTEEEMVEAGDTSAIRTAEEGSSAVSANSVSGKEAEIQRPQVSPEPQQPVKNVERPPIRPKPVPPEPRIPPLKNKKKRERGESMFHLFLEQAREDSIKEQEEMVRDRVMLARFLRAFEQDAADSREERRQCLDALRANFKVLRGIVCGLNKLTDALGSQPSASLGSQPASQHPLHSATQKENLPRNSTPAGSSGLPQEALFPHPASSISTAPKNGPHRPTAVTHPPPRVMCNLG